MKTRLLIIFSMILTSCSTSHKDATVMVTNLAGTSGGSGTVVSFASTGSEILTNRHVCGVVANGGNISSESASFVVVSYKVSQKHDLCLIHVSGDFGSSSTLSRVLPQTEDKAKIYGHPMLLPLIITEGYFSSKIVVPIGGETRECTDGDKNNPDKAYFCSIFGRLPIIEIKEAQVVSALIQPGSSGSAVYNEGGNIAGVVFAGGGNLGFAMIVPLEYVIDFIEVESKVAETHYPNMTIDVMFNTEQSPHNVVKQMIEFCKNTENREKAKSICTLLLGKTVIIGE